MGIEVASLTLANVLIIVSILGSAGVGLFLIGHWVGVVSSGIHALQKSFDEHAENEQQIMDDHENRLRDLEHA